MSSKRDRPHTDDEKYQTLPSPFSSPVSAASSSSSSSDGAPSSPSPPSSISSSPIESSPSPSKKAKASHSDPLHALPNDLVPSILSYVPNHLPLRLVSKKWDKACQYIHKSKQCTLCTCFCDSIDQFERRSSALSSWLKSYKLINFAMEEPDSSPSASSFSSSHSASTPGIALSIECAPSRSFYSDAKSFLNWWIQYAQAKNIEVSVGISRIEIVIGFGNDEEQCIDFVQSPEFSIVSAFALVGIKVPIPLPLITALSTSSHTQALRSLTFSAYAFDQTTCTALAECPLLPQIHTLNFIGCRLEPTSFPTIISSPLLPNLKNLCILLGTRSSTPCDSLVEQLASCQNLSKLERLSLVGFATLSAQGAQYLTSSPVLGNLRELTMSGCERIGLEGVKFICNSKTLKRLQSLGLELCRIGVPEVEAIIKSETLSGLKSLDASCNDLDNAAALLIASSRLALQKLSICDNRMSNSGALALYQKPSLKALKMDGNFLHVPKLIASIEESEIGWRSDLKIDVEAKQLWRGHPAGVILFGKGLPKKTAKEPASASVPAQPKKQEEQQKNLEDEDDEFTEGEEQDEEEEEKDDDDEFDENAEYDIDESSEDER